MRAIGDKWRIAARILVAVGLVTDFIDGYGVCLLCNNPYLCVYVFGASKSETIDNCYGSDCGM